MVVLVIAIVALHNPKHGATSAGSDTRVVTVTPTSTASKTPSKAVTTAPASSTSSSATASTGSTTGAIGSQPLIVLNDTTTPNLARDAASRFEGGGWNVTTYNENYSNDIVSTCAYYDPAVSGAQAAALALQKQYPTIQRVKPRFAELPAGPVVVVLTSGYSPS